MTQSQQISVGLCSPSLYSFVDGKGYLPESLTLSRRAPGWIYNYQIFAVTLKLNLH
jgi:hypothetical protein